MENIQKQFDKVFNEIEIKQKFIRTFKDLFILYHKHSSNYLNQLESIVPEIKAKNGNEIFEYII